MTATLARSTFLRSALTEPPSPIWDRPSFDFVAELEARVPEVRIPWQRTSFVTRCPLPDHEDRHPSCSMTLRDGVWLVRCHGCGFGGDGVDLLAALDGVTTAEWLRAYVRHHTALPPIPARPRRRVPPATRFVPLCTREELDGYVDACHAALLDGADSAPARRYARARGLTGAEVRAWRLGFGIPTRLPKLGRHRGRLIFPCPGGVESRSVDGHGLRYLTALMTVGYTVPFAADRLSAQAGPLVLAEGPFDALALRRAEIQAIALRGKTIAMPVARRLHAIGFERAYIALDLDAPAEAVLSLARVLAAAGIAPHRAHGLPDGDFGDLLTLPAKQLLAAVGAALRVAP